MYRLTARMLQRYERDLGKYHDMFSGGRCQGWEQEELIVAAIKSDTAAHHHVIWKEGGHDDQSDMVVRTDEDEHYIQIKSGEVKAGKLVLSGHRLGRFKGNLHNITDYLLSKKDNIISVAYRKVDDEKGRKHVYQVRYVERGLLNEISADGWEKKNGSYIQVTEKGVRLSLHPSMSWQIWWRIPIGLVLHEPPFTIP